MISSSTSEDDLPDWAGADQPRAGAARRVFRWVFRYWLRVVMVVYLFSVGVAGRLGPRQRPVESDGVDILLTGTFYSDHWLATHVIPLARSRECRRLRMVASSQVPHIDNVEAVYPPRWLSRVLGGVPARLLTFMWLALVTRPHIVGGFHLLVNGLLAVLLARTIGARSLYICGGGPREVLGGGYATENRLFNRLGVPDPVIERYLLRAVAACDIIVTMGTRAETFFRERSIRTMYHIVPGGFSGEVFFPADAPPTVDLILVGRLSTVKRVDVFLRAILALRDTLPHVRATVVGDGPLRGSLEQLSADLGLDRQVHFVGHQHQIETWLRRAKIFVLTSDSEGLSQAMIQAMMCGLPAVVSQVGDLADLVEDGINGYLVPDRTPEAFAERFRELLTAPDLLRRCSLAAHRTANRLEVQNVSRLWDGILAGRTDLAAREIPVVSSKFVGKKHQGTR